MIILKAIFIMAGIVVGLIILTVLVAFLHELIKAFSSLNKKVGETNNDSPKKKQENKELRNEQINVND